VIISDLPYAICEVVDIILITRIKQDVELTPSMLEELNRIGVAHFGGKRYKILADMRLNISSTPEARQYGAHNEYTQFHIAYALLVSSLSEKILANFFIRFNKPAVPSKMFNDENQAIEWLAKHS
jgi:hypothetical protein